MDEKHAIDNVVIALRKKLDSKTKERNEVYEQIAGLLHYQGSLDAEKIKLATTIDYLNNYCRSTLEVKDVAELLDPNG